MKKKKEMFLNPNKTLHTCKKSSCKKCDVANKLVCHFNGKQLFVFFLLNLPLFISAGYFISKFNSLFLIPWLIFVFAYFGLIEIRVMCSHCPHYAEPKMKSLKCWANYGAPKLWKYHPGPMSILEKIIFISGLLIILLPPVVFSLIKQSFISLSIYIAILIAWKIGLRTFYCKNCINFACPFNVVDDKTRNAFFDKNPIIKSAWKNKK